MVNHDQTNQSVDNLANLVKDISLETPKEPSTHNATNGWGPKGR